MRVADQQRGKVPPICVKTGEPTTDVVEVTAIAMDHAGMLWLAFTDGTGTWLERRACP